MENPEKVKKGMRKKMLGNKKGIRNTRIANKRKEGGGGHVLPVRTRRVV